jgi:DNA-binding SARP family transcriptional activator
MEFRILGPLEVLTDGRPLTVGGFKPRALLALLLLEANRVVSRDALIDALWEEDVPATVHKSLQVYVSQLRALLGHERLETRAPGYLLRIEPEELDLVRFERLREQGRPQEALALWRGAPLAEFAQLRFAQPEVARLEELYVACREELAERELARGRHAELAPELEVLVKQHPLRERLRGQLMLALYRCGRQADALEAFRDARAALVDGLGIEPGRGLRELHQAILEQDPGLDLPPAPAPEPAARRTGGRFVGRARELGELARALDDAFAGHGRLFLLIGEPGIGKSRLAEELISRAEARGARVLVGRCWEAGGAPAYWPWVQALRGHVRDCDPAALRIQLGSGAADLAQIVPELRERLADIREPPTAEPEEARFRLFDATAEFLRNASAARPIVLALDDLHAADEPSLLLLRFVARELSSTRVLVLGACRNVDPLPGRALAEMLAGVGREPVTRRLELSGLSEPELAELIAATASEVDAPGLAAELHEQTEGNPLFAGEIVRLLSVEGRRVIPDSVRDVIARRLTHLSEPCRSVLVLASVLGREFAIDALARISDVAEGDLLDLLDEAIAARVVSDVPGTSDHARFAHVLIRDTLYDGLGGARRVRLHRQVVDAFEALYGGEPGPHLAELAHHAIAGRDFDAGLRYAWRAADRALALLAYEESARLYAAALGAIELGATSDVRVRCELLLALGDAEARGGDTPAAKAAFSEAAAIAQRLGLAHELARAAMGYGGRILWGRGGDDPRLVPLLEAALAALAENDLELRARLLARLAGALRDEPSRRRRDEMSRQAIELARRTDDPAVLAYALDGRASATVAPDTIAERLAIAGELCEVAAGIGDRERVLEGHTHRHIALLQLGEVRRAKAELDAAVRIAHELGQPAHLWLGRGAQAMHALAEGRLDEAEGVIEDALALGERVHPAAVIPVHRIQRYTLHDFRGTLEQVEPEIRELARDYPARPVFRCVVAHLHARLARDAEARRQLAALTDDEVSVLPFDQEWLFGMSLLAETAALLGDTSAASVLYRSLLPWEALNAVDVGEGIRGAVSRYLGLLATTTARRAEGERHFEAALAMNARMGARPWLARTQEDYASMLLARDGRGDRERARELRDAALAAYRELGMVSGAEP